MNPHEYLETAIVLVDLKASQVALQRAVSHQVTGLDDLMEARRTIAESIADLDSRVQEFESQYQEVRKTDEACSRDIDHKFGLRFNVPDDRMLALYHDGLYQEDITSVRQGAISRTSLAIKDSKTRIPFVIAVKDNAIHIYTTFEEERDEIFVDYIRRVSEHQ